MASIEILIVLLLIVANGVLSGSEMAVVSSRRARLQARAEAGDSGAAVALELAEKPDRFLSTVQIGITLIGILAGTFGGATVSRTVSGWLSDIPVIGRYSDAIGVAVVVIMITYLSLVIGELVPKRLALQRPESIAVAIARPMRSLSRFASPAVTLLSYSSDALMRVLGAKQSDEPPITEEEIGLLLRQGAQAGVFDVQEPELVEAVFRLGDRRVSEVMTPRHRVVFLDLEDNLAMNQARMAESPHSHFPVCAGSPDEIRGVASVKSIWSRALAGEPTDLAASMVEACFVPESLPAFQALERLRGAVVPLAVAVDEYGGTAGILTLHDLMEAIVGDLGPEEPGEQDEAVRRADGSWLLGGGLLIDEVNDLIGANAIPEVEGAYQTLGGFLMTRLGRIPSPGEILTWNGWAFEVVDMDGNRVDKVLVEAKAPNPPTRRSAP